MTHGDPLEHRDRKYEMKHWLPRAIVLPAVVLNVYAWSTSPHSQGLCAGTRTAFQEGLGSQEDSKARMPRTDHEQKAFNGEFGD